MAVSIISVALKAIYGGAQLAQAYQDYRIATGKKEFWENYDTYLCDNLEVQAYVYNVLGIEKLSEYLERDAKIVDVMNDVDDKLSFFSFLNSLGK